MGQRGMERDSQPDSRRPRGGVPDPRREERDRDVDQRVPGRARTGAKVFLAGIYSNARGRPGKRLDRWIDLRGQEASLDQSADSSLRVVVGRTYWLAILAKGGPVVLRDHHNGRCRSNRAAQRALRSLPSRWRPGARRRECPISAHVDGRSRGPLAAKPSPGSSPVAPPAPVALPSGVTLQQIDGGPTFFSRFSNAAGWDSPNFYPIATFNQSLGYNNGNLRCVADNRL